jgi:hypothetical protein
MQSRPLAAAAGPCALERVGNRYMVIVHERIMDTRVTASDQGIAWTARLRLRNKVHRRKRTKCWDEHRAGALPAGVTIADIGGVRFGALGHSHQRTRCGNGAHRR